MLVPECTAVIESMMLKEINCFPSNMPGVYELAPFLEVFRFFLQKWRTLDHLGKLFLFHDYQDYLCSLLLV